MRDDKHLSLDTEERLPWLEPVEPVIVQPSQASGSAWVLVIAAIGAIILVFGGLWWMSNREVSLDGDGSIIAAPALPYKVRPDDIGGMTVEGQGDAAFAASEGADANGQLDLGAESEAPVQAQRVAPAKPAAPVAMGQKASATVAVGGVLVPARPNVAGPRPAPRQSGDTNGTGLIQLGTYSDAAGANQAYAALVQRYSDLDGLPRQTAKTIVAGKTFYQLRISAGAQAQNVCARLKAGGASCSLVK